MSRFARNVAGGIALMLLVSGPAVMHADDIDLSTWTAESYPAVSGFPVGNWVVQPGNLSVVQTDNGQPTFFYSDFSAIGSSVVGSIKVTAGWDDDVIGFALGFQPGDSSNAAADFLLIDWKKGTQGYDFLAPSCHPGGTAFAGLAVSRVTGVPTADEFWQHTDYSAVCGAQNGGLQELARGNTLGSLGWEYDTTYEFTFEFTSTSLKVYVDGVEEISIFGSFSDGRLAFYNFSQDTVGYSGFEIVPFQKVKIDIKPASDPNCFNNNGRGLIPVAILGSSDFDVASIDPTTLSFGGLGVRTKGNGKPQCAFEDVSGVETYRIEETEVTLAGDWFTEAMLEYSGGMAVYANFDVFDPEANATFEFVGSDVTWIGARTNNAGLFEWIVDEGTANERSGVVNTYIPGVDRFTTELLVDDLAPAYHTFKFVSLGIQGSTMLAVLPAETYVDAFDIVTPPTGEPDGYLDLVCHFIDDEAFTWDSDTGTAELTGNLDETFGGAAFKGSDSICIVPRR